MASTGSEAGALYSILTLERLRHRGAIPFAVLLLDADADRLYMRFRDDLADVADPEELDVLEGMADTIADCVRDEGATRLFNRFLDSLSGYVQMGAPHALPSPIDWQQAIDSLFERYVTGSHAKQV